MNLTQIFIVPEMECGDFLVKIKRKTGNLKKKGLRGNPKAFSGRNRKFKRFFRPKTGDLRKIRSSPKSKIQTVFPDKNSKFLPPINQH